MERRKVITPLIESIEQLIVSVRGQSVILDRELALLYDVDTRTLNQAVKRNLERFPADFLFQLNEAEQTALAARFGHLRNMKYSRTRPYAFTEYGAIMAASVLSSQRAVEASIFVVRAFVKLRQLISTHKELAQKLALLERKLGDHDEAIVAIIDAIKQLMEPPPAPAKPRIGFR
jgi:hypothetical protein